MLLLLLLLLWLLVLLQHVADSCLPYGQSIIFMYRLWFHLQLPDNRLLHSVAPVPHCPVYETRNLNLHIDSSNIRSAPIVTINQLHSWPPLSAWLSNWLNGSPTCNWQLATHETHAIPRVYCCCCCCCCCSNNSSSRRVVVAAHSSNMRLTLTLTYVNVDKRVKTTKQQQQQQQHRMSSNCLFVYADHNLQTDL